MGLLCAVLVLALSAHALGYWRLAPVDRLDLALYDLRLAALADGTLDERIVLVDIDEKALSDHGRWPWPRSLLAELVDRIGGRHGARVVALDLVLAEADDRGGSSALRRLLPPEALAHAATAASAAASASAAPELADNDARLARSLARWPSVLGFMLSDGTTAGQVGALPPPWLSRTQLGPGPNPWWFYPSATGNLPVLQQAVGLAGHLNALVDGDGRLRRVPLLALGPDGQAYPSLALAALQRLMLPSEARGAPTLAPPRLAEAQRLPRAFALGPAVDCPVQARQHAPNTPSDEADDPDPRSLAAIRCRALHVPMGVHGDVLVPFKRAPQPFTHWSAADVLSDQVPPGALRGRLVLVGVSAPGLIDQRMTPLDDAMQGSAVHASLLSALLDGQLRTVPVGAPLLTSLTLAALAVVMVWGLRRTGMVNGGLLTLGLMLVVALVNAAAWAWGHWALPWAAPLLLPPLLLALHLALAYRAASGARAQLTQLFGQYVPPELVHEMSREPERHSMTSRSAELSVLFADVRGFSGLAERLPPGELSAMMNLLFSHLTDAVQAQRGTLDKYIGDAVMAFWGAPLDDPQHAAHAVAAALAMRAQLPAIHAALRARGWPAVDVQIGINTGPMVVGDMGSRHRRAYTVMGDAVNLAARLQQLCSQENLGLVVGDATQRALGTQWCLPLGRLPLRGREQAERVWVPLPWRQGDKAAVDQAAQLWLAMREATEAGDAARALTLLERIDSLVPGLAPLAWQRRQLKAMVAASRG